jgi:hypothetical protein
MAVNFEILILNIASCNNIWHLASKARFHKLIYLDTLFLNLNKVNMVLLDKIINS